MGIGVALQSARSPATARGETMSREMPIEIVGHGPFDLGAQRRQHHAELHLDRNAVPADLDVTAGAGPGETQGVAVPVTARVQLVLELGGQRLDFGADVRVVEAVRADDADYRHDDPAAREDSAAAFSINTFSICTFSVCTQDDQARGKYCSKYSMNAFTTPSTASSAEPPKKLMLSSPSKFALRTCSPVALSVNTA